MAHHKSNRDEHGSHKQTPSTRFSLTQYQLEALTGTAPLVLSPDDVSDSQTGRSPPTLDTLPDEILLDIHKILINDFAEAHYFPPELGNKKRRLLKTAQFTNLARTNRHMRSIAVDTMIRDTIFVIELNVGLDEMEVMLMAAVLLEKSSLKHSLSARGDHHQRVRHLEIVVYPHDSFGDPSNKPRKTVEFNPLGPGLPDIYRGGGVVLQISCDEVSRVVRLTYVGIRRPETAYRWKPARHVFKGLRQVLNSKACADGSPLYSGLKLEDIRKLLVTVWRLAADHVDIQGEIERRALPAWLPSSASRRTEYRRADWLSRALEDSEAEELSERLAEAQILLSIDWEWKEYR